jgi:hypothetical protein
LRDALHDFSDHLPVTVSLETDATLLNIADNRLEQLTLIKETLVRSTLTLLNPDFKLTNKTLVIYNSLGQPVKRLSFSTEYEKQIDVNDFEGGLYVLVVEQSTIAPVKFMVN